MAVTHNYTIICDDVRREDNGKLIILGMYMGTITVPSFPAVLPTLTILSLVESDRPGQWSFRLAIQNLERGNAVMEARGFANVPQPGPAVMPIKFGGARFEERGNYTVTLEVEGQREPLAVVPLRVELMPQQPTPGQPSYPIR
jgi:hypothetical protein